LRCSREPIGVIAFGLFMSCFLPSNWEVEMARLVVLAQDGRWRRSIRRAARICRSPHGGEGVPVRGEDTATTQNAVAVMTLTRPFDQRPVRAEVP
jgi:hypothetical protein